MFKLFKEIQAEEIKLLCETFLIKLINDTQICFTSSYYDEYSSRPNYLLLDDYRIDNKVYPRSSVLYIELVKTSYMTIKMYPKDLSYCGIDDSYHLRGPHTKEDIENLIKEGKAERVE